MGGFNGTTTGAWNTTWDDVQASVIYIYLYVYIYVCVRAVWFGKLQANSWGVVKECGALDGSEAEL